MWDQGRVHYTSSEIWFQPSAIIDEMMSREWLPDVVETVVSDEKFIDVTAKTDEARSELKLYIVNIAPEQKSLTINVEGFKYKSAARVWTLGGCELTDYNTVEDQTRVAPVTSKISFKKKDMTLTVPRYSYTVITLTR